MSEPTFSMTADDDLPRTIRREREAREREARGQSAVSPPAAEGEGSYVMRAPPAVVTDFDVPFLKLMAFFIKAVFAAIPSLLILTLLLWVFGQLLQGYFPQLMKLKILIYMPQ